LLAARFCAGDVGGPQVICSIYERWNRNDGDLARELFDPSVEIACSGKWKTRLIGR
jgi:hypothetical protein